MRRSTKAVIQWALYVFGMILLLALQSTPRLFAVFGIRPILLVPAAVCIAMHTDEHKAAVVGALTGMLWDSVSDKLFGFSAIILMLCCVAVSLMVTHLVKLNFLNTMLFVLGTLAVYEFLNFVFYYAIWNYNHLGTVVLCQMLPTILYTLCITPLFYWAGQRLYRSRLCSDLPVSMAMQTDEQPPEEP